MLGVPIVTAIFGPTGITVVTWVGNLDVVIVLGCEMGVFVEADAGNASGAIMPGEQAHKIKVQKRSVFESLVI